MKYFTLIILFACTSYATTKIPEDYTNPCVYESEEDGLLLWNDSCNISWNNFKRVVEDTSSYYKAKAIRKVTVKNPQYDNDSIIYLVRAYFNESESYRVNDDNLGVELLLHEQLHFDMSEVLARKIRRAYSKYTSRDGSLYITSKFVNSTFKKLLSESDELNKRYDKETNHGVNKLEQEKWNNKITKMLNELKNYSNPRVVMRRQLSKEYLELGKEKNKRF